MADTVRDDDDLAAALERSAADVERLTEENRLLRAKVDALVRKIFGPSSEALDPAQLELLLEADDGAKKPSPAAGPPGPAAGDPESGAKNRRPKAPRKPRVPENLPVEEEQTVVPEPVKACPDAWRKIGEEVTEELDYQPAHFFRRRLVRPKFVRRSEPEAAPIIAPLPGRVIEGGIAAPGLVAQVVVAKYCDHLPLYRQEKIYGGRHGVEIPRQSLARWVEAAAEWLKPVYGEMLKGIFEGGYVQVDETPVKYLEPGAGKARQGYYWVYSAPGGDVAFDWRSSRAAACLSETVPGDFDGTMQNDGYSAYPAFAKAHPREITFAACWAHVRRKFHDALEASPRTAAWFLLQIGHLYRTEARLRGARAGPKLRDAARAHESAPVYRRIGEALHIIKTGRRHLPKSPLGAALNYALGQWAALGVYLGDGRVEIDNNGVENAIRPTAVGKKNWLFVGADAAGPRGAVLYSVIESCRRRGIEPYGYLKDVLARLPNMTNREVWKVTPANWAKERDHTEATKAAS